MGTGDQRFVAMSALHCRSRSAVCFGPDLGQLRRVEQHLPDRPAGPLVGNRRWPPRCTGRSRIRVAPANDRHVVQRFKSSTAISKRKHQEGRGAPKRAEQGTQGAGHAGSRARPILVEEAVSRRMRQCGIAMVPLFTFEELTVAGPARPRLAGATASVPDAGITVIVGPSGSGKSTLLRCCNRLEVPTSGRVLLRGEDVASLDPLQLRRRVGMVFQRPTPFAGSVLENLQVAAPDLDERSAARSLTGVGLDATFLPRPATELSGGESQRLCLARTLVTKPEVVLLDEVTASVDPAARLGLESLARDLACQGTRVMWVTHDLDQLRRLAEHVLVLIAGRVAFDGSIRQLDDESGREVKRFLAAIGANEEVDP